MDFWRACDGQAGGGCLTAAAPKNAPNLPFPSRKMLPRKRRLPAAFFSITNKKKVSSPHFLVKCSPTTLGYNRFGIVISVKMEKSAARRHFWKRRIRVAVSRWPERNSDFLLIVSRSLADASEKNIQAELAGLGNRV